MLDPIKINPLAAPPQQRGSYRKRPYGDIPLQAVTNHFPQAGGNRITEAPEVVFDLTLGVEGVETPLPNDSLKASRNPPVGPLCSFRRDYKQKNAQTTY